MQKPQITIGDAKMPEALSPDGIRDQEHLTIYIYILYYIGE